MRARALDKVNARKTSASNLSGSSGNLPGSNDYNPYRRSFTAGSSDAISNSRISSAQEAAAAGGAGATTTGSKIKRRSFGASDRSQSLRITTVGNTSNSNSATKSEAQHNNSLTPPTLLRKRTSGPVKSQQLQPQQLQQPHHTLFTSEDDSEVPGQTIYQDRTRYASEGGVLVSEIKALKARVQELEQERMDRSLTGLSVQSPQVMTPKSMDHSTTTATSFPSVNDSHQQQSSTFTMSHSEKLQQIIQKHRGSSVSLDLANPLRSPLISAMSDNEASKDVLSTRTAAAIGGGRLEPSLSITSPARSPLLPSSTPRQPTTQHVDLLNIALKNYEKWSGTTTTGTGTNLSFQAISRVVTNAISMNQTIRAWVNADVSLVESSSMNALQRASDEQIRSLTEFLLAATRTPHLTAADRTNNSNNPTSDTESVNGGGSVIIRPYSPRQSTAMHHRFGQGQRLSLGMVANELGAGGYDANPPYPTRPLSTAVTEPYEILTAVGEGGGAAESGAHTVGNGIASSGYLTRTSSIASSNFFEPRARSTGPNVRHSQGGYASDYSYDRHLTSTFQGLGLSRNQLHQQHQQQQQGGGALSSRENSPPQEEPRGMAPRRQASGLLMMNAQPTSIAPVRNLQSLQNLPLVVAGGEGATAEQQQLARRQASVRNIMARYSQGAKSPNVSGLEQQGGDLQDSVIDQSQGNGTGRPLSRSLQYDDGGPRSPVFNPRQVAVGSFTQDQQQYRYRQQLLRQDDVMSASEGSFGPGHEQTQTQAQAQARMGGQIRRPLSQQDHHRSMTASRLSEPAENRYGSLGVRAGQRYAQERTGAFSEDENASASDWGSGSQRGNRGVVVVNPQRASMDSYTTRLKQFRGRHEQQLPFHQEGLSFEEPYSDNGHQSRQGRQQYQEAFSEGVVDVDAGDALSTGPVPRFAQRQTRYQTQTQSQYLDKPSQHRQGPQQHQYHHHQDMMMSTPSLPSPNSSPSSSARLDAPSLMMSLSNHGQGGGLVGTSVASSSSLSSLGGNGVDGRYHLSPRGPAGAKTFPRQGLVGLNGEDQQQQQFDQGSYQGQRRVPMAALQTAQ
ncbi:hypothetical protein BGZ96_006018 [Linnemannia gamsii]|uniref:Uncharacterized protein n=1 Tax=Linnemannia gamsii TaxID=64522 RepID=A0ABQ7KGB3_9FUNG|nr:hypothetical protein BGZ96_006018 [Linnemannia gamsii]